MSNAKPVQPQTYRDWVMTWGNQDPWKRLGIKRLNHQTKFTDSNVKRDGRGNILDMPLLKNKPCFGRPEAVFRHGKRTRRQKVPNGYWIDTQNHQCGRCPEGVHGACVRTALERVNSDPAIRQAYDEWRAECEANHDGAYVCTGTASWPWGRFKDAIARRGPFENSNDNALRDLEEADRERERRKWLRDQRRRRERQRAAARAVRRLPSHQFVLNVRDERDRRSDLLLATLGKPGQPKCRSQVIAKHAAATAIITANAWAVGEIIKQSGAPVRPGSIARVMADHGLSAGVPRASLNARIKNDLARADGCVADGVWQPFNPDADLESCLDEDTVDDDFDSIADLEDAWEQLRTPSE
jgi:hypothetical protein